MNFTPQQLAQALVRPVSFFGDAGPVMPPTLTPLNPMQMPAPSGGSSMLDPAGLMKMFGGLMGGVKGGVPPNPGGAGYMDAGSTPNYNYG